MQIGKKKYILSLIAAFMVGALLMGGACAVKMHSSNGGFTQNDKLKEIQKYIDSYYFNDYKQKDLYNGIYKGYVEALGDPYSEYMTATEFESWNTSAMGKYSGVGITFQENANGQFVVVGVNKNSPAEKAGVKEKDYILSVDGKEYTDSDVMAANIRGKKGTEVTLQMLRDKEEFELTMERDDIIQESVSYKMLDGNVAYIEISSFMENTSEDFSKALKKATKQGAESLILDLRDNGGGLVDECVEIADEFLDKGVVCYVEDKNGNTETYDAKDGKTKLKTVVLVNENSASASEILAGAMKDNGYPLVGTKTFGKGVIQTTLQLDDGSALKLTIMQYLSPGKHKIHKKGIKPNYLVKDKEDTEKDEQLDKAETLL